MAVSVIAHMDADILIIDEALSAGDAAFSQKRMQFLHEFHERGTIFFVGQDLSAVKAFCDQAIWLDGRKVRDDSSLAEPAHASEPRRVSRECTSGALPAVPVDPGRQVIEAFRFNPGAADFGNGNGMGQILSVQLTECDGRGIAWCEGSSQVILAVLARANVDFSDPILGFFAKYGLGQPLIGGNTFLTYQSGAPRVAAGQEIQATFSCKMPVLPVGDYSITAAIARGTLEAHVQRHWVHDATLFRVTASSLDGVLARIPIDAIEFGVVDTPSA